MNIMENKRVTAIAALLAVGFLAICYKGYEKYSVAKEAQEQISQANSKIEGFASDAIPPTAKNSKLIEQASAEVEKLAADLSKDLSKYVTFCVQGDPKAAESRPRGYEINVKPVAFQNRLKELSAEISRQAKDKCALNNGSADFGMSSLKNQAPREVDAPYLNFLLSAVERVEQHIISSGARSIERVYCAPLPDEEINARKKPDFFPMSFEVAFTARRSENIKDGVADTYSTLPQVMNKIVNDDRFFLIITGMAVSTPGNLPPVSNTAAAESGAEAAEGDSGSNASLLIGKSTDEVNVHLTLQVLYFTTDKL